MKTSCELIRDLLPLYYDGICSDTTKRIVEEHLAECKECSLVLQKMSVSLKSTNSVRQDSEEKMFSGAAKKWKMSLCKSFAKGILLASLCFIIFSAGRYGLCKANFIAADNNVVDTTEYIMKDDVNNIAVVLETTDGYSGGTVVSKTDEKGNVYLSIVRPIMKEKNRNGDNLRIIYTVNIENKNAVYYGSPDNRELLWDKNTDLPQITYEEIALMHYSRTMAE
ncbi:MAG: zf-HC2 domain-containing protein [Lachnospiraceae bacterium]|nr:zf-HC2 domain-containing protein [Lachnospiraceae bacterium]